MYARILAAVDGSRPSTAALRHATDLAREQGARLRIVHVIEDPYWYFTLEADANLDVGAVAAAWREAGRAVLDDAGRLLRDLGVEPDMALIEQPGIGVADAIVHEAERWPADLIVMGTHGRHGVERLLLGSVAEGVARTTTTPLLLLRPTV
jgi:nucleotide-binding universal stress UspA family protein